MAISNSALFFLVIICSSAPLGFSQGAGDGGAASLPCVRKLLPCQPYLKLRGTPPASCCIPMKEMVVTDSGCLCQVFNNPALLKGLNVTQDDGLGLAKACGAKADTSLCGTRSPPSTPGTPTGPSVNITAGGGSPPVPEKKKSAAESIHMISQSGRYISIAALFTSLFVSLL